MSKENEKNRFPITTVITAGSSYLDIDAYACCVAMKELLELKGQSAVAYSNAPCNYSVSESLIEDGQMVKVLPSDLSEASFRYVIVDVSDPEFIKNAVPLDAVFAVYDHHVGFEAYWKERIGDNSHIEFIGAAATLIYREWKKSGVQDMISRPTSLLLIAAILDNTLNLTSSNTTPEDIDTFNELCKKENIDESWCAAYFSEVQKSVESELKSAIFNDIKYIRNNGVLPSRVAQLCVWDANSILDRLPEIRQWFSFDADGWMLNLIDLKRRCSYFVCDDSRCQKEIARVFGVCFESGVAKSSISYLRKEIIKKTILSN